MTSPLLDVYSDIPWWLYEKSKEELDNTNLANCVVGTVQDIERRQSSIAEGNRRHAKIYAGYLPNGLAWGVYANNSIRNPFPATKAVVRSVCDTATALIVRSRPRAAFVTTGADWKVQTQAEDLEQFCIGAYSQSDIYQVAPRCFHDSTVFGTGIWKYVPKGKGEKFHVKVERVLPDDFLVDENECREHLEPINTYHRMMVRADAVIQKYAKNDKDLARRIRAASANNTWPQRHIPPNYVIMIEAIHIDKDNPDNNRRVLAVNGVTLADEKWRFPWHPYTILWWSPPISGFYGDGVAYRQYGRQERINYLYRWVQRCHDLFATPRAWVDPAGGPPTSQLSNELGQIIVSRKPPTFQVTNSVPPEIYHWLDNLERGGMEDEGISTASAHNELPQGIESAPAQREWSYKEGQRFAPVSQRWEHAMAVEAAQKIIAFTRDYAESSKVKPKVKWADRKMMYSIEWPDLDEDAYMVRQEAANLDSLSPAARIQSALELAQTGWLLPGEGRELIAHPDLKEADVLGNAGISYAKFVLRKLYRGDFVAVDEKADLAALDRIIRAGRLVAIQRGAPDDIVANLDHYLEDLDQLQQEVQAAAMAQMPGNLQPPTNQVSEPYAPGE